MERKEKERERERERRGTQFLLQIVQCIYHKRDFGDFLLQRQFALHHTHVHMINALALLQGHRAL